MSSESLPITPAAFAEAIKELPLSAIHAKASEIRNSIAHLQRSNEEIHSFINESDEPEREKRELQSYIVENEGVIASMQGRIELLKNEVEARGQLWVDADESAGAGGEGVEDGSGAAAATAAAEEGGGEMSPSMTIAAGAAQRRDGPNATVNGTSTSVTSREGEADFQEENGVYL